MSEVAAQSVRERLADGPARGLGCAGVLAVEAVGDARVRRDLVGALRDARPVVAARAANALKKVQAASPRALDAFAKELLLAARTCEVRTARWNLLLVTGQLQLKAMQRAVVMDLLLQAMANESAFERVHAMQALVDVSGGEASLRDRARRVVEAASEDSSAAVRARARKLLRVMRAGTSTRR